MSAYLILFGVLGAVAAVLIVTLLRRGGGGTENAEGLFIEASSSSRPPADRLRRMSEA